MTRRDGCGGGGNNFSITFSGLRGGIGGGRSRSTFEDKKEI
jgi:hypothetical protein